VTLFRKKDFYPQMTRMTQMSADEAFNIICAHLRHLRIALSCLTAG